MRNKEKYDLNRLVSSVEYDRDKSINVGKMDEDCSVFVSSLYLPESEEPVYQKEFVYGSNYMLFKTGWLDLMESSHESILKWLEEDSEE